MTFKCMNGMAPTNLSSRFVKRGSISGRSTRNANNPSLQKSLTKVSQILLSFLLCIMRTLIFIKILNTNDDARVYIFSKLNRCSDCVGKKDIYSLITGKFVSLFLLSGKIEKYGQMNCFAVELNS